MIALIISGKQDEYAPIKEALEEKGYNCIHYTNFMKAYDNLEELSPDVVIISIKDYPRHWKIVSFADAESLAKKIKTIILVPHSFKGIKEAEQLCATPFIYDEEEGFNKPLFMELLNTVDDEVPELSEDVRINSKIDYGNYFDEDDFPAPTVEELLSRAENDYMSHDSKCSFIYMNPSVMSIITGKVISFIYPEICFLPDRKEGFQSIYIGQILDDCSLKTEIGLSSVKTCVTDVSDTITMHIC